MSENISENMIVRDIVVKYPGLRFAMEKLGVDYCCGGKHSLKEAAAEKGLDLSAIVSGLNDALAEQSARQQEHRDWSKATSAELIERIVNRHHAFLKEQLPRLELLLNKVVRVHGPHHPELHDLAAAFQPFKEELDQHMMKEENILFPTILRMESDASIPGFALEGPISQMQIEHDSAGRGLELMRQATSNYQPPARACGSYIALFEGLAAVEADLHEHIHLENNILFPRTLSRSGAICCSQR